MDDSISPKKVPYRRLSLQYCRTCRQMGVLHDGKLQNSIKSMFILKDIDIGLCSNFLVVSTININFMIGDSGEVLFFLDNLNELDAEVWRLCLDYDEFHSSGLKKKKKKL